MSFEPKVSTLVQNYRQVQDLIAYCRIVNVRLWVEGARLRISAPAEGLDPDLRAELVEHREQLVALLDDPAPLPLEALGDDEWSAWRDRSYRIQMEAGRGCPDLELSVIRSADRQALAEIRPELLEPPAEPTASPAPALTEVPQAIAHAAASAIPAPKRVKHRTPSPMLWEA